MFICLLTLANSCIHGYGVGSSRCSDQKLLLVPGSRLKTKEDFVFEFAASKLTLNALQCHLIPVDWIYLFFKFVYDCESLCDLDLLLVLFRIMWVVYVSPHFLE